MRLDQLIIVVKDATTLIVGMVAFIGAIGSLVEALSKKHSPLTWIGKRVNKELLDKFEKFDKRLDDLEDKELKRDLQEKRSYILDYANSLRQDRRHTVEEFDHVIELIDEYHELCEKNEITNGVIDIQSKYIVSEYMRLSRKGSFQEKVQNGDLL